MDFHLVLLAGFIHVCFSGRKKQLCHYKSIRCLHKKLLCTFVKHTQNTERDLECWFCDWAYLLCWLQINPPRWTTWLTCFLFPLIQEGYTEVIDLRDDKKECQVLKKHESQTGHMSVCFLWIVNLNDPRKLRYDSFVVCTGRVWLACSLG